MATKMASGNINNLVMICIPIFRLLLEMMPVVVGVDDDYNVVAGRRDTRTRLNFLLSEIFVS